MITISDHAYKRAKQRMGFSRSTTEKMARIALLVGFSEDNLPTLVRQYVEEQRRQHWQIYRVYGDYIFLFAPGKKDTFRMVTVMRMPSRFKKLLELTGKNK